MSDHQNSVEAYTINALHEMTGIDVTVLEEKAKELSMDISHDGHGAILRSDLPVFFEDLFKEKHYKLTYSLPKWLRTSSASWTKELCDLYSSPMTRPTSLSPQQGEFLRSIVVNSNPKSMVEIGTFLGVSTLWVGGALKDANKGGKLHSIDLHSDILPYSSGTQTRCILDPFPIVKERIVKAGLNEQVTLIQGDSKAIGKEWHKISTKPIDILYIDGDHSIKGCINDFDAFIPYLKDDSIIILHDVFPSNCKWEGPRFLIDNLRKIATPDVFELETSPHNFGMAVIRMGKIENPRKEVLS